MGRKSCDFELFYMFTQVSEVIIYCFTTHYQLCSGNHTGWFFAKRR
jgi:hypothetical protein